MRSADAAELSGGRSEDCSAACAPILAGPQSDEESWPLPARRPIAELAVRCSRRWRWLAPASFAALGAILAVLLLCGRSWRGQPKTFPGAAAPKVSLEETWPPPWVHFPISFEEEADGACPRGWTCTGPAAACEVGSARAPCRPYPGIGGHDGKRFLAVGSDEGTATAVSPTFPLPEGTSVLCFKRSGGADAGSGFFLVRLRDSKTLCVLEYGENKNSFSEQCCPGLAQYVGEEVAIRIVDAQKSSWGKVLVDDIRLFDAEGHAVGNDARQSMCGLMLKDVHYEDVHNLEDETRETDSAADCCKVCEDLPRCGAWEWGHVRNSWLTDKCFLKELINGRLPERVAWPGISAGLPARSVPAPVRGLNESEYVEQDGAQIPASGDVRLYGLGSNSMLWASWIEELHFYLLRLGFRLPTVEAKVEPQFHPLSVQTCDDSIYLDKLRTARFARIGWCSWEFANEGWEGCAEDSYRRIAGHRVKCQHGPGCRHSTEPFLASKVVDDAGGSDITLVSTWFNDDQQEWSEYNCFDGKTLGQAEATEISIASLLQLVRKIHARNPKVWVVILGKYPHGIGHVTRPSFKRSNMRVKAAVEKEPRTLFVAYDMPPDNVTSVFQARHPGYPNCRGSKLIAMAILQRLYEEKILGRGLRLHEPTRANLVRPSCSGLSAVACHTSVTCWVDPADGKCKTYSRGTNDRP